MGHEKDHKKSKGLTATLPRQNSGRAKRFLENRLILEDWQIKVPKMIKNIKKKQSFQQNCVQMNIKNKKHSQKFGQCFLEKGGIFIQINLKINHVLQKT
jgi:hypothetical protein